jgi:hypothetical protein
LFTLRRDRPDPTEVPEITQRHRADDSPFLTERHHVPLIPFLSIPAWPPTSDPNGACKTNPSFTTFGFDPTVRGACESASSSTPRADVYLRLHGAQKPPPFVYSHPRKLPAMLNVLSTASILTARNGWLDVDLYLRCPEGPVGTFARISLLPIAAPATLLAALFSSMPRRYFCSQPNSITFLSTAASDVRVRRRGATPLDCVSLLNVSTAHSTHPKCSFR